jgi:hypothetical protein
VSSAALPDLYSTLGISRDAGEMEIRGAYGRAVLAAQESKHRQPSRELLDFALATLTDPEMRARYDAQTPTESSSTDSGTDDEGYVAAAFGHARNGALWFAGGGLVTALSYASTGVGGKYFIAWGAVIFGAFQLLRGLAVYLRVPGAARTGRQVAIIGALAAIGALSSSWVIANETGVIQDPAVAAWNASFDKAEPLADKAAELFRQVSERSGTWSAQDSADMREVSRLCARVADLLSTAPADATLAWYRDGLVENYRDASSIANGFSALTAESGEAEFDSLNQRWGARIADLRALSDRFDKQFGSGR